MLKAFLTILLTSLVALPSGHAEIHKWVDENGRVHYSDQKPTTQKTEVLKNIEPQTYTHTTVFDLPDFLGFFKSPEKTKKKKVVMYSTQKCSYCKRARRYFKSKNIPFVEKDINKSKQNEKEWQKLGGGGVPIILIGKKRMNGFSASRFDQIYKSL